MSDTNGAAASGGADANGKQTTLVTLDHFAEWILQQVYRDGLHENAVERRFIREQLRHVANAALQQAAQRVIKVYGSAWTGVAQEILRLRTREPEAETYGDVAPDFNDRATMVVPVVPTLPGDGEEPEVAPGEDGVAPTEPS